MVESAGLWGVVEEQVARGWSECSWSFRYGEETSQGREAKRCPSEGRKAEPSNEGSRLVEAEVAIAKGWIDAINVEVAVTEIVVEERRQPRLGGGRAGQGVGGEGRAGARSWGRGRQAGCGAGGWRGKRKGWGGRKVCTRGKFATGVY
eukprot:Gb_08658 [translate_table: standard]